MIFIVQRPTPRRDLPSFPTRRSSDLDLADREQAIEVPAGALDLVELDHVALRAELLRPLLRELRRKDEIGFGRQEKHFGADARLLLLQIIELVRLRHPDEVRGISAARATPVL